MLDIAQHQNWEAFKALLLHREDRERRARGEPALEEEIAQEAQRAETPIPSQLDQCAA